MHAFLYLIHVYSIYEPKASEITLSNDHDVQTDSCKCKYCKMTTAMVSVSWFRRAQTLLHVTRNIWLVPIR